MAKKAAKEETKAAPPAPPAEQVGEVAAAPVVERKQPVRQRQGIVIKNKMSKTVVVELSRRVSHQKYIKFVRRRMRYAAHTEEALNVGDSVLIEETRPLSKTKRWKVKQVLQRAEEV